MQMVANPHPSQVPHPRLTHTYTCKVATFPASDQHIQLPDDYCPYSNPPSEQHQSTDTPTILSSSTATTNSLALHTVVPNSSTKLPLPLLPYNAKFSNTPIPTQFICHTNIPTPASIRSTIHIHHTHSHVSTTPSSHPTLDTQEFHSRHGTSSRYQRSNWSKSHTSELQVLSYQSFMGRMLLHGFRNVRCI
jgi:hypothetical protein